MPEEPAAATASVPNPHHRPVRRRRGIYRAVPILQKFWLPLTLVSAFIFFLIWLGASTSKPASQCVFKIPENPNIRPVRMTTCVTLETARTNSALILGLSGRTSMDRARGMLFVFDQPSRQCMWMKDMHFALDMLWLDDQNQIIHIEKNVKPESYPDSYCGPENSKYVVELNTGIADQAGLHNGQKLEL